MKLKSILAAAVVIAGAFAGSAQASAVWTVTTHGTIYSGTDYTGVFGPIGSLVGMEYTQTITASVDPSQYADSVNDANYAYRSGFSPAFTDTVTVNGTTLSVTVASGGAYAWQYISDNYNGTDNIRSYNEGVDVVHNKYVYADNWAYTYLPNSFVTTVDFGQTIDASVGPDYTNARFQWGADVSFYGTPDHITVNDNGAPANVPEPASIALLAFGLAGMGALRRRKSS